MIYLFCIHSHLTKFVVESDQEDDYSSDDSEFGRGRKHKKVKRKSSRRSRGDGDPFASYGQRFSSRSRKTTSYIEKDEMDEDIYGSEDEAVAAYPVQYYEDDETEAVDIVMDHRTRAKHDDESDDDDGNEDAILEFLIKWKGLSHIHNTWEPLQRLRSLKGFKKVENYIKINVETHQDMDYALEQLEMKRQSLEDYIAVERVINSRRDRSGDTLYYCKWKSLPYSESTWETAEDIAPFQDCIDEYLNRQQSACVPHRSTKYSNMAARKAVFRRLTKQPEFIKEGKLREYQLEGVSWLAYLWSTDTNGILADEMVCPLNF